MADVTITVDGKQVRAPAGTLLIEACKSAGIEVPSFFYYPGLSLEGACRMCLVEIAIMPKPQTACTVPITDLGRYSRGLSEVLEHDLQLPCERE